MKKILLATTALVAVSAASVANAQETAMMSAAGNDITVGGYYEFGYISADPGPKDASDQTKAAWTQTYSDGELFIDFDAVADNGLEYGIGIDLELTGNRHQNYHNNAGADAAELYFGADWGRVTVGNTSPGASHFLTTAPTHEGTLGQDDVGPVGLLTSQRGGGFLSNLSSGGWWDRNANIKYQTPSFSSISAAISYSDGDGSGSTRNGHTSVGAGWSGEVGDWFGGTTVGVTLATLTANNSTFYGGAITGGTEGTEVPDKHEANNGYTVNHFGLKIGLGDATITAGQTTKNTGGRDEADQSITEFGLGYQVNDGFSIGVARGESKGIGAAGTTAGVDDQHQATLLSASGSYNIAPGLKATLGWNSVDVEYKGAAQDTDVKSRSSIVAQIEFSF